MNNPTFTIITADRSQPTDQMMELLKVLFMIEKDFTFEQEKAHRAIMALLDDPSAVIALAKTSDDKVFNFSKKKKMQFSFLLKKNPLSRSRHDYITSYIDRVALEK